MASITPTVTVIEGGAREVFWEQINDDDEGGSINLEPKYSGRVVHMVGTFNGGAYTLECSPDNTNWTTALDNLGNNVTFSAAGNAEVATNGRFWRVSNNNAGTTEDVDVYLYCVG